MYEMIRLSDLADSSCGTSEDQSSSAFPSLQTYLVRTVAYKFITALIAVVHTATLVARRGPVTGVVANSPWTPPPLCPQFRPTECLSESFLGRDMKDRVPTRYRRWPIVGPIFLTLFSPIVVYWRPLVVLFPNCWLLHKDMLDEVWLCHVAWNFSVVCSNAIAQISSVASISDSKETVGHIPSQPSLCWEMLIWHSYEAPFNH